MEGRLPEVRCGAFIEADFDDSGKPGFELKVEAKYRNLPQAGLLAIERELFSMLERVRQYGESLQPAAPGE